MRLITRAKAFKAQMKNLEDLDHEREKYWEIEAQLKSVLMALLRSTEELRVLSKAELYLFIALCSSHRPSAPHTILGYLSELNSAKRAEMRQDHE